MKAAGGDASAPADAHPDAQPPNAQAGPKFYASPGPEQRQQIESLSGSGTSSAAPPDAPAAPKFVSPNLRKQIEALSGGVKSASSKCEAIRLKAVKCLREATAKEEWSDICRPHIDEYVTRCKRTETK